MTTFEIQHGYRRYTEVEYNAVKHEGNYLTTVSWDSKTFPGAIEQFGIFTFGIIDVMNSRNSAGQPRSFEQYIRDTITDHFHCIQRRPGQ